MPCHQWLGGVWSEEVEGTNGIGTCIAEKRPVTVHRSQHFRARHVTLSCSGAPIFDVDGELAAVLDVSSNDPQLSEGSHAITGALAEVSARAIEERCFRDRFRREWIVAIVPPDSAGSPVLFAVDQDYRVIGADRHARTLLEHKKCRVQDGLSLWSIFARDYSLFRQGSRRYSRSVGHGRHVGDMVCGCDAARHKYWHMAQSGDCRISHSATPDWI